MDLNLIKKLVKIVDTSGVTDLEIEEDGLRIKVAKKIKNNLGNSQPQMAVQTESGNASAPQVAAVTEVAAPAEQSETSAGNFHEINSPIVGTFYRAPAPDADPYVQVGDSVSPGTVLCVVEAMKLMNEIESDIAGKVVKIFVENGKPVEYNQPLFFIEPT
jgi:acetyl-CoA carboxylase biotin carboxyl carrier protein